MMADKTPPCPREAQPPGQASALAMPLELLKAVCGPPTPQILWLFSVLPPQQHQSLEQQLITS